MPYKENPKLMGSGIDACIPQERPCPLKCPDCFFNGGRSYLEPLAEHLPNMPDVNPHRVVRVNDGNDSNVDRGIVLSRTQHYPLRFYNTSIPVNLAGFIEPVVLTVNPGAMTDHDFYMLPKIPANLMFVRFRTNTWNLLLAKQCVDYYTQLNIPVILTFMAYFHTMADIPPKHRKNYTMRKRTSNEYLAITTRAWRKVMNRFKHNKLVYGCGKIEGESGDTKCRYCGNCLREFFACKSRLDVIANAENAVKAVNSTIEPPEVQSSEPSEFHPEVIMR